MSDYALPQTAASIAMVAPEPGPRNGASLADELFAEWVWIKPETGLVFQCDHCELPSFKVLNDHLIVRVRHHGMVHTTVRSLESLGYVRRAE